MTEDQIIRALLLIVALIRKKENLKLSDLIAEAESPELRAYIENDQKPVR
jgi:hypothetical protein